MSNFSLINYLKNKKLFSSLAVISLITVLLALTLTSFFSKNFSLIKKASENKKNTVSELGGGQGVVRGVSGDLWADVVIGKRDFSEIGPNEIVPYKLFNPGGVIVDRSVSPGRLYVWDSGNNRVLGVDLAKCYGSDSPCSADIVIGQPSLSDYGACNLDSSMQNYPERSQSSASTLCGSSEEIHTVLEDKTYSGMFVDQEGNLYIPDTMNHRVLKYIKPFETDTIADEVWGQPDFVHNQCNVTGQAVGGPSPTASSLCSWTGSPWSIGFAVTIDSVGNLWVADGGNNRVLRFSKGAGGTINKTADLVLGQQNFTSKNQGNGLNQMSGPNSLSFDKNNKLYVSDANNGRILVFNPLFTSGMSGTVFGTDRHEGLNAVLVESDPRNPQEQVVFVYESRLGSEQSGPVIYEMTGPKRETISKPGSRGGGSIGIDGNGNIIFSIESGNQDVFVALKKTNGSFQPILKRLFSPPYGYNKASGKRFATPAWVGVATAANQLIVGEGRLLFWNDLNSLTNGKPPDGYIGASSAIERPGRDFGFAQVKSDASNRVWVLFDRQEIRVYQAPLTTGAQPIKIITGPFLTLGADLINPIDILGLAPTSDGNFLWLSEPGNHRVYRLRNPLTANPVVDVILGQIQVANNVTPDDGFNPAQIGNPNFPNLCNRRQVPPPNAGLGGMASLNMLCFPGAISLDKHGNLFLSDHIIESAGNWRLLMFAKSLFPDNPTSVIFAPDATKSFPYSPLRHMTFEPAFDSANQMVIGNNPYSGNRFVSFYNDPLKRNSTNPSDPNFAQPDGYLKDFYGWPVAATFDSSDNLYVYDANRGQVRKYLKPLYVYITPTITPIVTPTSTPISTPTPTIALVTLTPTATPTARVISATPIPTTTLPVTCQAATTISLKFCYGQCASCENACGAHACIRVFHPAGAPADPDCVNYGGTTTEYTAYKCTDTLPKSICSCTNLPTGNPTPGTTITPVASVTPRGATLTPILAVSPTPTPSVSITPIATATLPAETCPLKSKGDADCNNLIDINDFFAWRREFLSGNNNQADFNKNGTVDIIDFNAWRNGFLGR